MDRKERAPLISQELRTATRSRMDQVLTGSIVLGATVLGCGSTLYDFFGTHDVRNGLVKAALTVGLLTSIRHRIQTQQLLERIRARIRRMPRS